MSDTFSREKAGPATRELPEPTDPERARKIAEALKATRATVEALLRQARSS